MGLERLFLDEALEADVTLERPDAVVDEHVPLQVGGQGELSGAHVALVAFHPLHRPNEKEVVNNSYKTMRVSFFFHFQPVGRCERGERRTLRERQNTV